MANSKVGSTFFFDTTGTAKIHKICGVNYSGAASGTVVITGTTSGNPIMKLKGTPDFIAGGLDIKIPLTEASITVTITNSAEIMIYGT